MEAERRKKEEEEKEKTVEDVEVRGHSGAVHRLNYQLPVNFRWSTSLISWTSTLLTLCTGLSARFSRYDFI